MQNCFEAARQNGRWEKYRENKRLLQWVELGLTSRNLEPPTPPPKHIPTQSANMMAAGGLVSVDRPLYFERGSRDRRFRGLVLWWISLLTSRETWARNIEDEAFHGLKSHPTSHRPTHSFFQPASQCINAVSPACLLCVRWCWPGARETQGTVLAKARSHKRPDLETGAGPLGFTSWLLPVPPPGPSTGYQVRRPGPEKPAVVCNALFLCKYVPNITWDILYWNVSCHLSEIKI